MISEEILNELAILYIETKFNNANPALKEILNEEFKIIFMQGLNYCSDIYTKEK